MPFGLPMLSNDLDTISARVVLVEYSKRGLDKYHFARVNEKD